MTTCAETEIDDPGVAAAGAGAGGDEGAAGAGVEGCETAGAPGTMPSAIAVVKSTTPEAASDRLDWNAVTAAAVAGPNTPSTPPRTEIPASTNAFWSTRTRSPR